MADKEDIISIAENVIDKIRLWLTLGSLELAEQWIEAILVSNRKNIRIRVDHCRITAKETVKHLGVMMDYKLKFKVHLNRTNSKTATVSIALRRLMTDGSVAFYFYFLNCVCFYHSSINGMFGDKINRLIFLNVS